MSFYNNIASTPQYKEAVHIISTYEWWYKKIEAEPKVRHCRRRVDANRPTDHGIELKTMYLYPHKTRETAIYDVYLLICDGWKVQSGEYGELEDKMVNEISQRINEDILNKLYGHKKEEIDDAELTEVTWNVIEKCLTGGGYCTKKSCQNKK